MSDHLSPLRRHARAIWDAAVAAARPEDLLRAAFADPSLHLLDAVARAPHILVVGGGKAGAAMSAAVEEILAKYLERMEGIVNVPAESVWPLRRIRLHAARPAGTNEPTADGVAGTRQILNLVAEAGPDDVALCLLSGGGSALLPAPVAGVTLEDKQEVTRLLHACGATITEMNTVRKHLSRCKGGQLAQAFTGRVLFSLIISDVIADPLDVIASGPTAADPTTFADALAVLQKYGLIPHSTVVPRSPDRGTRWRGQETAPQQGETAPQQGRKGKRKKGGQKAPSSVLRYLEEGAAGAMPETLKTLPSNIRNYVIGNNTKSLAAAQAKAEALGYRVLNLGAYLEGETRQVAVALAGIVRSIRADGLPLPPPGCVLCGGETTVTLSADHGLGGRNQEFVLAMVAKLGRAGLRDVVVLSGGTDGEDGPTDAAGAIADENTLSRSDLQALEPAAFLARNDAYHFFEATADLLKTGLTHTNVMDVRVILVK